MSTNPNNAVGTNGAYDGRTSVNAFNDVLGVFTGRGVLSGWALQPSVGMVITIGGSGSTRDVAIAEDNIGNKTTINNISEAPISVTIPAAPATNSRIDLVVAYVDNPPQGSSAATDNYGACGLIVVSGAAASSPVAPDDTDIRTAITSDGGAGTIAYYVVLGSVRVSMGTTDIDDSMITNGSSSIVASSTLNTTAILNAIFPTIFDRLYPVGSIYTSTTLTTATAVKNTLGGGTWVAWGSGRVPVGVNTGDTAFNTVEKTGGEKVHTLTTTEMPAHTHDVDGTVGTISNTDIQAGSGICMTQNPYIRTSTSAGGGGAHNNLQPYITCYMYKRTA